MSGTNLIGDAKTMITNGPSATTASNANSGLASAAYPSAGIVDYTAMLQVYRDTLKQLAELLTMLKNITDAGDPNLAIINADITTLGS